MKIETIDKEKRIYSILLDDEQEVKDLADLTNKVSFGRIDIFEETTTMAILYNVLLRYICTKLDKYNLFDDENSQIYCYVRFNENLIYNSIYKIQTDNGYEYSYCIIENKFNKK